MPLVADRRLVLAPDYPGYGASAPPAKRPTITDYATAMCALLDTLDISQPVDVLGFHTGCLVGVELATVAPERVRRLLLVDVPYYLPDRQRELLAETTARDDSPPAVASARQRHGTAREGAMPRERIDELFAEHRRVLPRAHWGFQAAFSYPCETRFAALRVPTRVVATRSPLLEPTRAGAAALPGAELVERLDITRAVFEEGAPVIATEVMRWSA
jgi:pimeloyl-ACP methyl ester carboxylesterase